MWMLELLLVIALGCGAFFGVLRVSIGLYDRSGERMRSVLSGALALGVIALFVVPLILHPSGSS